MGWSDKVIESNRNKMKELSYSPREYIDLQKIIHCLSFDEFSEMYNSGHDGDPRLSHRQEYLSDKFDAMKRDLFHWVCELDSINQRKVFDFAAKKAIIYALKKV